MQKVMKSKKIRIAGIAKESIVDGKGVRFAIFCQGCPHHCQGCHNPETHDFNGGKEYSIEVLFQEIKKNPLLSGVTFSGGEPICQSESFLELAKLIKKENLDITVFTGYTMEELEMKCREDAILAELLLYTDYLIEGRFVLAKRNLTLKFRGSSNQRFIDMNKTREQGKIVLVED